MPISLKGIQSITHINTNLHTSQKPISSPKIFNTTTALVSFTQLPLALLKPVQGLSVYFSPVSLNHYCSPPCPYHCSQSVSQKPGIGLQRQNSFKGKWVKKRKEKESKGKQRKKRQPPSLLKDWEEEAWGNSCENMFCPCHLSSDICISHSVLMVTVWGKWCYDNFYFVVRVTKT